MRLYKFYKNNQDSKEKCRVYFSLRPVTSPACKIVIAHFGFPYILETANIVSKNKNVYTEISGTIDVSGEKITSRLVAQYVQDLKRALIYFPNVRKKVMFGTDFEGGSSPLGRVQPYIELVETVFSRTEKEYVFHELANKIFF
jgi:predicted TIM-barrel fold metal-dependent hydrolase